MYCPVSVQMGFHQAKVIRTENHVRNLENYWRQKTGQNIPNSIEFSAREIIKNTTLMHYKAYISFENLKIYLYNNLIYFTITPL